MSALLAARSVVPTYERRAPESTLLYKILQTQWRTFEAELNAESVCDAGGLPAFVHAEFESYLRCGIAAHGFVRVRCNDCGDSRTVAFSCKRRGFCPSCIGRCMNETAAHLVDDVLPHVPVRQWVLSVPHRLRYAMAHDPALTSVVCKEFLSAVTRWIRWRLRKQKVRGLMKTGAATAIQRFDSALALNVHFHALVLDGAYSLNAAGKPQFHAVAAPDDEDVGEVAMRVYTRVAKLFDVDQDAVGVREPAMAAMAAASLRRMVATGSRRGLPIRRLKAGQTPVASLLGKTCAEVEGFNIHANVRVAANDRVGLEALCRYIARPPLSDDRLQERDDGTLSLRLKRAWSDGTTHLLLSPGELIEKLIPLIPRPRSHTMRYHGVLAPASGWRAAIVPRRQVPEDARVKQPPHKGKCCQRIPWAALLMRVFKIDVLACGRCGGRMKVLAAVFKQNAVEGILDHLGETAYAPLVAAARAPPDDQTDWL